jgi:A/G-specific adenine glycosylase
VPAFPVELRTAILAWYDQNGRTLAFRTRSDPYAVLVSETMAQQTQISRVDAGWQSWMARFPTIQSLAAASPAQVLRQWAGLGYNRRALNLHRAARAVLADHGGRLPSDVDALMRLPGIGPYTARAVAAIGFGRPIGAVDTNVRRVLGRAVAGTDDLAASDLQAIADAAVPEDRAAAWTHALMDVGAAFCRPRTPRCNGCPARPWCRFASAAAGRAPITRRRRVQPAFETTTRWLRGRIVEQLRDADGWVAFGTAIGRHDVGAVRRALDALAREGLIELDGDRARLPVV